MLPTAGHCDRERERQRDRETETETERQRARVRQREKERDIHRQRAYSNCYPRIPLGLGSEPVSTGAAHHRGQRSPSSRNPGPGHVVHQETLEREDQV